MSSLFRKRKVITWLLLIVTIFQVVFSSFTSISVYADGENANTKLSNYLKLAKGKTINDIDVSQITQEELRMLGVYLSNFYIPMSTELSSSRDDSVARDNMVSALVEGASFDEDLAEVLVSTIWDMTMQSAKPLYIGKIVKKNDASTDNKVYYGFGADESVETVSSLPLARDDGGGVVYGSTAGTYEKIGNDSHVVATYASFLDWFSGLSAMKKDFFGNGTSDSLSNRAVQGFLANLTLCLYWIDDSGNRIPVFNTHFDKNANGEDINKYGDFTASSLSYGIINDNLNYNLGVGSALADVSLEDYNNLTDEQQKKVVCIDSRLYVDCFGNILVDYGVAKYVLVPACVNPYAWNRHNNEGVSSTLGINNANTGKAINLVNLFMLDEARQGHIDISEDTDNCNSAKNGNPHSAKYRFGVYTGDHSLFNLSFWRLSRNSKDLSLDRNTSFWKGANNLGDGKDLYERVKIFFAEDDNQQQRFFNWITYSSELAKKSGYSFTEGCWCTNVIDDFILLDSLNEFKSSDPSKDYELFNLQNDGKGGITDSDGSLLGGTASSNFSANINSNEINIVQTGQAKRYLTGIYISYALAFYDATRDDGSYYVNYSFSKDVFPSVSDLEIDWSNIEISQDSMDNEIKSMIYYFLHPTEGISYVAKWFKNKVSGILVSWHEDMAGSSDGTSTTGSTKYLGFSGYVTLPTLSDVKWTSWLLGEYNNIVVYLIIVIFIVLIAYCIVGSMTFQRAILGAILFGVLAFFPPLCINATVNFINNTCDDLYGDKFTYWALVQHQTYITDLNNIISSGDKDNYLAYIFEDSSENLDSTNYARVKLKWLSPKKIDVTADVTSELSDVTNSSLLSNLMRGTLRQQLSGETFLDTEDALYLYRDYADIYGYMINAYNTDDWYNSSSALVKLKVEESDLEADTTTPMHYNSTDAYGELNTLYSIYENQKLEDKGYSQKTALSNGFLIDTGVSDTDNKSYSFLLDSGVGASLLSCNKSLLNSEISSDLTLNINTKFSGQKFGLATSDFDVTLAKINGGVESVRTKEDRNEIFWQSDDSKFYKKGLGNFYFGLYTESPFYFFSWNILDQQNSSEFSGLIGNSAEGLDSKLLDMYTINNQQYFYNYDENSLDGFGEMRDFCNMRALFYYVIPYLRECNRGIDAWSNLYGTFLYEDVSFKYDSDGNIEIPDFSGLDEEGNPIYSDEYIYKWWHNYNVERLFNTYSPWVDLMYSCSYADSETISILGEKYKVLDPLDPTSYFKKDSGGNIVEGRLMVFSRTEMEYYGLTMKDLTQVEQKIIKVQDQVYEDLLQLMDYADFENEVLVTSAGMLTTFAFNKEFSQTTPFGTSYTLYPQSYELKAFSYDAYLRLILAESTGEDLMNTDNNNSVANSGNKSYYQRIVENSSITTGIAFIILDIFAVYAIPALKLFFLVAIFFMSILMIVAAAVKLEMNMVKTTWEALLSPLIKFSAVSIGLAWVVSLFMSNGNTAITGRGGLTISLGDPAMVLLVMIVINIVVLILYYKICKKCFKQMIDFAKAVGTSIGGAVAGTLGKMTGLALGGKHISDSVARGTAKGRGKSNLPSANTSSGSGGGSGSKLGSFAKGALFGKVADDISDAVKGSGGSGSYTDKESKASVKPNKYDKTVAKAKEAQDKVASLANKEKSREDSVNNIRQRSKQTSESFTRSADSVANEREKLKNLASASGVGGKMTSFVKDKGLAAKEKYYRGAGFVNKGVGSAKASIKKGAYTVSSNVRNSGVGKTFKIDDTSRMERAKARAGIAKERARRQSEKAYRCNLKNKGKGKK